MYSDPTGYGILPVGGFGTLYKDYKSAVLAWAAIYAPISNGVEYGAIFYSFRALFWTYYFIGETYKGFKTTNWYTVVNGLGAGYFMGRGLEWAFSFYWPFASLQIIGFVHTHPLGHTNKPSGPDKWLKGIGFFVGGKVFPIVVYNNSTISVNYF